jgi:hypothetical protein
MQNPEDSEMRRQAARTLRLSLRRELGARDALRHGALPALLALVRAGSPDAVRDEGYAALSALAALDCGRCDAIRMSVCWLRGVRMGSCTWWMRASTPYLVNHR